MQTVTQRIDPPPDFDSEGIDELDPEQSRWYPIRITSEPSPEVTERILAFSAEFGLLGLLHRRFSRIVGPIISEPSGARQRFYCERGANIDYVRSTQWGRSLIHSEAGETMPLVDRYEFCVGAPHGRRGDTPFDAINRTYFDGQLPAAIPEPDSIESFRIYGEPVEDWIEAAVELATAIRTYDAQYLNQLLRVAWADRWIGPEMVTLDFRVGSLLEAAAFQFFEDISGGFELRYCENRSCARRLYYDNDPRSRFCSQRCASAERQREHRAAKRAEREAAMRRRKR